MSTRDSVLGHGALASEWPWVELVDLDSWKQAPVRDLCDWKVAKHGFRKSKMSRSKSWLWLLGDFDQWATCMHHAWEHLTNVGQHRSPGKTDLKKSSQAGNLTRPSSAQALCLVDVQCCILPTSLSPVNVKRTKETAEATTETVTRRRKYPPDNCSWRGLYIPVSIWLLTLLLLFYILFSILIKGSVQIPFFHDLRNFSWCILRTIYSLWLKLFLCTSDDVMEIEFTVVPLG